MKIKEIKKLCTKSLNTYGIRYDLTSGEDSLQIVLYNPKTTYQFRVNDASYEYAFSQNEELQSHRTFSQKEDFELDITYRFSKHSVLSR